MDAVGIAVVPRPIKLNSLEPDVPERILELEGKSSAGCDIVIQNILPHHMTYHSAFRNIGVAFLDSLSIKTSSWGSHLSMMDEVWVTNEEAVYACEDAITNMKTKVSVLNCATDLESYKGEGANIVAEDLVNQTHGDFLFYFLGDFNRRKNLAAVLRAYHTEFTPNEPVSLVIKTSQYGVSPQEMRQQVIAMSREVRANLRLYPSDDFYKKEIILTDNYSNEEILSFHKTCDCLVNPSYGEGWGYSVIDAMGMGSIVIVGKTGAPMEYVDGISVLGVKVSKDDCFGMTAPGTFHDLFTAHDTWSSPSIIELRDNMRSAYRVGVNGNHVEKDSYEVIEPFSRKNVGNEIKELLEQK